MTFNAAKKFALKYSEKYLTFWHVKKMKNGTYEPYAFCDESESAFTCYCGKEF